MPPARLVPSGPPDPRPGPHDGPAGSAIAPPAPPPRAPFAELERPTLDRARAGDPMAQRAFVVRYERPVFALLSRMLGRGPHVEDLAQDTFLRALRALPGFDPGGPARLSTWLLTIATRLALDALKKKRLPLAPPEAAHDVPDAATPETERARRELGRRLEDAARSLSDDHRAALLLVEVHGFSLAEAGEALSVPEATVKTRVFRARQRMRAALGEAVDEPARSKAEARAAAKEEDDDAAT